MEQLLTHLFNRWLLGSAGSAGLEPGDHGRYVLNYGQAVRWTCLLLTLSFPALFGGIAVLDAELSFGSGLTIGCVFAIPGVFLCCEVFRTWVAVDSEQMTAHSAWSGTKSISWEEIASVGYSQVGQWFIVRSRKGKTIRLSVMLSGVGRTLDQIQSRYPPPIWQPALPGMQLVRSTQQPKS